MNQYDGLLNNIQSTSYTGRNKLHKSRAWVWALVLGLAVGFLVGCSI